MFNLLRYFSLASAIALTVIAVMLVHFYRQNAVSELIESAENQNVTLARSFANVLWPRFSHYVASVSGMDGDALRARPETRELDTVLKTLTTDLPVLKVKIYDLDGLTVYSSQSSQMGTNKSNNLGFLQSAQDGKPASKLSFRDTFSAFSGTVENRDLVESYLPIWAGDGAIEGVFELYTDVTPLMARVERRTIKLIAGLLLSFGLLYGVLCLIVRRADRILGRQYSELKQTEEALGRAHDELETRVLERTNELRCEITERKQAEEGLRESESRLAHAAKMAKIGYWVWDEIEDKAIYCSDELAGINGIATGRELAAILTSLDKDLETIHPDDRNRIAKVVRESVAEQRGYDTEFRMIRPDGEIRHLREILEPVLDDDGNLVRSNGIIQDITDRKQAEDQLRQAQKMEAVGQLTAGVAHDFNNMLAVIWGNAELLEDELGEDNPLLAAVCRATKRGAELTQRLLAFSRKQMLQPKTINANSLITETTGLLRRTLEAHIDIKNVTAAGLWNCEVDPAQLENALVNLSINARDAMPDGGKLTIETSNVRLDDSYAAAQADVTPGQYVMLAVTDTGSGMAPEVRARVFEPFFTTKGAGEGTGLGLSMVYGFVKQSGGHVTIYSEQGEGTTIKLYLPRSTKPETAERKPVIDEAPVARGETVLVVEDDPDLRTLAVALLSNLGYQVMAAGTAAAALEQLGSTARVNLLLTDVVLPGGMNGRELAAEVGRRDPDMPVLYMSGYTEDAIMHHGRLDAGAELLQKPFRRVDLARAARKVLDGRSA